jgi:DNA-binding NarL/FixJ family response regulator
MRSPVVADLIWCRLNSGENVEEVIAPCLTLGQPVVVLADEPDETVVVAALEAGAAGCCNSRSASEVLQQVTLVVSNGGLWVGQSILRRIVGGASRVLGQRAEAPKDDSWSKKLSERECQVAKLVASGESNKEIADHLAISERTVKAHLTSVFEKLGLRDRLQLSLRINGLPG